jgi:hypothetical protein
MHSLEWEKSVSSSTSSSEANRWYARWVLVLAFLPGLLLFIYGIYLQPLYGDLTRIGLYPEREFGWHTLQQKFQSPAYTQDEYNRYQDIVILGDSFSRAWPHHQWQNHVIAKTGWSIATLDINQVEINKVLTNPTFQKSPPKVFVLESVERNFAARIGKASACRSPLAPPAAANTKPWSLGYKHGPALAKIDEERPRNWSDVKLEFVWKYVRNTIRVARGGQERTDVRKLALSRQGLFSSANQRDILIYSEDLDKSAKWSALPLSEISCRVQQIREQVERNGTTRFVLLIAPDKLTAYSEHLADETLSRISMLTDFAQFNEAFMPRIDLALKSAIKRGEKDVYLPDDTHWGSTGHRIAAEAFMAFLQR